MNESRCFVSSSILDCWCLKAYHAPFRYAMNQNQVDDMGYIYPRRLRNNKGSTYPLHHQVSQLHFSSLHLLKIENYWFLDKLDQAETH